MRKLLFLIIAAFTLTSAIYSQSWISSSRILSTELIVELSSAIDDNGNIYSLGYFNGTLTASGGISVTSNGGRDYFVAKFQSDGTIQWLLNFGSELNDYVTGGISVDSDGEVLITGAFASQLYYSETEFLESTGALDMFILKLDTEGNVSWARNVGRGFKPQASTAVTIHDNDAILAGFFVDSINFEDQATLYSKNPVPDMFYASFNASNGDLQWVKQGHTLNTQVAYIWQIKANSDSYLMSGFFVDSLGFENDTIVPLSIKPDAFLIKSDHTGQIDWIRTVRGLDNEFCYSLAIDDEQNCYMSGYYTSNELVFDSNETDSIIVKKTYGKEDIFIAKYKSNGDLDWYKTIGGKYSDKVYDLAFIDDLIYISGYFTDTINWGGIQLTSSGSTDQDMLSGALDKEGNFRSANSYSGINNSLEESRGLFINNDKLYIVMRTNSELLVLGDDIYTSDGESFSMIVGVIGCLPISIDNTIYTPVTGCYGDSTGAIQISASGGFGSPWQYSIDNNETSQESPYFPQLPAGDYQVVVYDSKKCTMVGEIVSLDQPDSLEIELISAKDITVAEDGAIEVGWQGGTSPYTLTLLPDNVMQGFGVFTFAPGDSGQYVVQLNDGNQCGPVLTDTIEIKDLSHVGMDELGGLMLRVFPNPATDLVTVEMPLEAAEVSMEVVSLAGQVVLSRQAYTTGGVLRETIDVSDLADGMYMLRVNGNTLKSAIVVN